ncbi:hypothetical protein SO3561_05272 [Streptomyces olivochromogenes]|uniref:Uncharacterized protein n=1 Tax=Streptomyces olivochromogenes TaxID=1963 RepID=A0A250VI57_STROL|nr:hypothetical protein SO3561_05272 [Streptomyces olivochromogenes]
MPAVSVEPSAGSTRRNAPVRRVMRPFPDVLREGGRVGPGGDHVAA